MIKEPRHMIKKPQHIIMKPQHIIMKLQHIIKSPSIRQLWRSIKLEYYTIIHWLWEE